MQVVQNLLPLLTLHKYLVELCLVGSDVSHLELTYRICWVQRLPQIGSHVSLRHNQGCYLMSFLNKLQQERHSWLWLLPLHWTRRGLKIVTWSWRVVPMSALKLEGEPIYPICHCSSMSYSNKVVQVRVGWRVPFTDQGGKR